MYFEVDRLDGANVYKLMTATVVPRPIAWLVTLGADGRTNAAPFSFFNVMSGNPPVVAIGIGSHGSRMKDSARNIRETAEFVVNLVPYRMIEAMNITAVEFEYEVDELVAAKLRSCPSRKVAPPRIADSPVAFECKLRQFIDIGAERSIVLGDVLAVHIDDAAVIDAQRCHVDTPRLDLVARMHGRGWYARTSDRFELPRMTPQDWAQRQADAAD